MSRALHRDHTTDNRVLEFRHILHALRPEMGAVSHLVTSEKRWRRGKCNLPPRLVSQPRHTPSPLRWEESKLCRRLERHRLDRRICSCAAV